MLLLVGFACNSEPRRDTSAAPTPAPAPPPTQVPEPGSAATGYAGDIEKLCDVIARSGTEQSASDERMLLVANWLAANLETQEARDFLVQIQPLVGEDKARALEAEAKRVGLAGCALAAEWRTAP